MRLNEGGKLRVPWGYVAALQSDPIEKKPFFHVLPGSNALTFGMLGCDFHCGYCQNWLTSQAMRDPNSDVSANYIRRITPERMLQAAQDSNASLVVSSYNEPLITSEWAVAIFKEAKAAGLMCAYVSNGNTTPEVMEYLRPYLSAYKIDLKCMQDKNYRKLGGVLQNTLDGIQRAHHLPQAQTRAGVPGGLARQLAARVVADVAGRRPHRATEGRSKLPRTLGEILLRDADARTLEAIEAPRVL